MILILGEKNQLNFPSVKLTSVKKKRVSLILLQNISSFTFKHIGNTRRYTAS